MTRRRGWITGLAACAAILGAAAQADAAFPGENGRIVFGDARDGALNGSGVVAPELYSVRPDGTDARRLTHDTLSQYAPAVSPDGRQVAFTQAGPSASESPLVSLATLPIDGGPVHTLIPAAPSAELPRWTPDGQWLWYQGEDGIERIRADGTGREPVAGGGTPIPSPDGTRIAFQGAQTGNDPVVWTMRPDGSDARSVAVGSVLDWSPDGAELLVSRYRFGPEGWCSELFAVPSTGGPARQISRVNPPAQDGCTLGVSGGSWSPDGRWIAFSMRLATWPMDSRVLVVPAAGGAARTISGAGVNGGADSAQPSWARRVTAGVHRRSWSARRRRGARH